MKIVSLLREKLRRPPRLSRWDILWTLAPALIWWAGVESRQHFIEPHCFTQPANCTVASIPAIDRVAIGWNSSQADYYSYVTQNASGIAAIAIPTFWTGALIALKSLAPAAGLLGLGTDIVIVAQTAFINGAIGESTRLLTQRARPFVYADLAAHSPNPANYTSFYSGHTSFSAATVVALLIILMSRGMPRWRLRIVGFLGIGLIVLTAVFRILAGRHFPTDVLAGAIAGSLVAVAVALVHRREQPASDR